MDDEKMIRAVLAGHALQGLLARDSRLVGDTLGDVRLAVAYADALLVELKKDSPAPASESAPPLAAEARASESVFTHPCCEAYGCDRPGINTFHFTPLSSGRFCDIHVYVRPESILLEWHGKAKKARAA